MRGLDPDIHGFLASVIKTWMVGTWGCGEDAVFRAAERGHHEGIVAVSVL
jgi:hypothetical protein